MFTKSKSYDNGSQGLGIPPAPEPAPTPALPTAAPAPRAPEPSRPARSSNLSTLSAGVKYEGNISGAGELQIDGSLKGDVRVSRVVIGEGGSVEGTVHADVLDVRGRVSGAIVAKQVKLYATARVEGDITPGAAGHRPGRLVPGPLQPGQARHPRRRHAGSHRAETREGGQGRSQVAGLNRASLNTRRGSLAGRPFSFSPRWIRASRRPAPPGPRP